MKKIFILSILGFTICFTLHAQQSRPGNPIGGIIVKGGKNPGGNFLLNLGGGLSNASTDTKENNFIGSGKNVNVGVYLPVYSFGPDNNFTFGPNITGNYLKFEGDVDASPKYNVTGQTSPPTAAKSGNGNVSSFTAEAGLHANFSFGNITVSPILNVGYLNFKQDGFKVTQASEVNGKTYNFDLYEQKDIKESGFAIIPKLRVGYFPGKLGLFLESNYTIGPEITSSQSTLKPLGTGNDKDGSYQFDQLMAGKQVESERATPFKNLSFNFGVSYAIRKAHKSAKKAAAGANTNPYFVSNELAGEMASITTGNNPTNESSLNRVSITTSTDAGDPETTNENIPTNQSIVNTSKSNTKDRVAVENTEMMQVSYAGQDPVLKQTQLSVLGSGKTLANGTPIVAGREVKGKITGSIIIASSSARVINTISIKQPESGDEGSAILDKEGNFTINLGSDTLHRVYINDKEFGIIKIESQVLNPLFQDEGKLGDNPNAARPGEPIGGIIVKGGRNPGGQMILTSNSDGSFTFQNSKTADFKFTFETPETNSGVGNAARPGEPIGGIIVKGGRNPGGQMFTTSANGNGEVEFKNLPAGDYKFTVTAPTDTKQYESFRKGWDGTVKGGSVSSVAKGENPLFEDKGNSGVNPMSESSNAARPGQPIGGIIVKGGRNPGGQMRLTSNSDGSFTFQNSKTADFKFTIETPETNGGGGNAARPGEPIGGIIVKGGRNPGGQMFTTTASGNGEVEFKNLPAGNYKFTITAPTEPKQYESFRKGWDGTVKGGSKNSNNKENPVYQPNGTEHTNPMYKGK